MILQRTKTPYMEGKQSQSQDADRIYRTTIRHTQITIRVGRGTESRRPGAAKGNMEWVS
jgi:hypothetical protein